MTGRLDSTDRGPLTALILAGERGGDNPVAQAAGVTEKCWVPAAGVPMLLRVVDTLCQCRAVSRIAISLQAGATDEDREALVQRAAGVELTLLPAASTWILSTRCRPCRPGVVFQVSPTSATA